MKHAVSALAICAAFVGGTALAADLLERGHGRSFNRSRSKPSRSRSSSMKAVAQ